MNPRLQSHPFWGPYAPFSALTGACLLTLATTRLSVAVVCAGAVLWVYALSALTAFAARPFLPRRGAPVILLFLTSLIASLYLLLLSLLNPLIALASWFPVILIAPCLLGSRLLDDLAGLPPEDCLPRAAAEAASLAVLIVALALVREPLGLGALSLPGGPDGIVKIFDAGDGSFPIRALSTSGGALILLGYSVAVFRYFKGQYYGGEKDKRP